jgi:hypothetical protein
MQDGAAGETSFLRKPQGTDMATITGTSSNNTITGTISDDHIDGNDGNDTIYGGGGNDWLYGGLGWTDHLYGGYGDDTFIVRDMQDVAHEYANEGWDTVVSTVSYMLGANIENLTLLAGGTGIGNDLDNEIIGNNADNFLDGRLGNDALHGGGGTDTADYSSWDAVVRGMTVEFDLSPEIGGAYRYYEQGGDRITPNGTTCTRSRTSAAPTWMTTSTATPTPTSTTSRTTSSGVAAATTGSMAIWATTPTTATTASTRSTTATRGQR